MVLCWKIFFSFQNPQRALKFHSAKNLITCGVPNNSRYPDIFHYFYFLKSFPFSSSSLLFLLLTNFSKTSLLHLITFNTRLWCHFFFFLEDSSYTISLSSKDVFRQGQTSRCHLGPSLDHRMYNLLQRYVLFLIGALVLFMYTVSIMTPFNITSPCIPSWLFITITETLHSFLHAQILAAKNLTLVCTLLLTIL